MNISLQEKIKQRKLNIDLSVTTTSVQCMIWVVGAEKTVIKIENNNQMT